jgi:hypothetical protein
MIKIDFKPKSILAYLIAFGTLCLFIAGFGVNSIYFGTLGTIIFIPCFIIYLGKYIFKIF